MIAEREMVCMYVFSTTRCRDDLTGMYMYSASYLLLCELAYMIGDAECRHGRKGMKNGQVHY